MNLTNLRANLYKVVDEIIQTGEPVEVLRHGHTLKLELDLDIEQKKKQFLAKLKSRPHCIPPGTTEEDLINTPSEWNYDFS